MDLQKEREAFERHKAKQLKIDYVSLKNVLDDCERIFPNNRYAGYSDFNRDFETWLAAKAQAVPEQDQQVFATNNLTWKDIAFRALSCKVLKSTENWVHVKNIACVGSTTASLICKKLGVNPDGTKFELIEAQEPTND